MTKRTNVAKWQNNRWQIQVQHEGVRKSFYSSIPGKKGQREAHAKADEWLDEGIHDGNIKISALWELYLADVQLTAGTSQIQQIQKCGKNYILPVIENIKIGNLNVGNLQDILNKAYKNGCLRPDYKKKRTEPLSRKTLQDIRAAISGFIKWARKHQYTSLLTEDLVVPQGARLKGRTILQPDSLVTLFTVDSRLYYQSRTFDHYIYAYRFAVATGLRPGELAGLQCGDIIGRTVNLERSINRYGEKTLGKNENAIRSFEMNEYAFDAYQGQLELLRSHNVSTKPSAPLFPMTNQQNLYNHWKKYQKDNNIPPVSLYELRHTFVSVAQNLPDGLLKPIIGHSRSMDTRGVYAHLMDGQASQTAAVLTDVFSTVLAENKKVTSKVTSN